jgi:hypothetical protein
VLGELVGRARALCSQAVREATAGEVAGRASG